MAESLREKTFKGTVWSAVEKFSVQGVQFFIMLFMARLLSPSDYGTIGMISIFTIILGSLVDSGFAQALIRKIDRTEVDNSTVFYFNIVAGVFLYGILYLCAPLIADFYNVPILTPLTRAVGMSLIFNSLCVVQRAQYTLNLDFRTQAKASLSSAIVSGIIGIYFAYKGHGVWALVYQTYASLIVNSALLWWGSKWRPIWAFSWSSLKEMFGFGSKLLLSGLLDKGYINMYQLVIGKVFSAADLGLYSRAQNFSSLASENITSTIQRVTYPVLCSIQNEDNRLRDNYRLLIRVSAFIIFPLMIGMAAVAKPMIITLVTEKWIYSATLLVPICLSGMWYPVHAINLNLLMVKGRSDLFLRLEIIKKVMGVTVLVFSIPFGLLLMCWFRIGTCIIGLIINTYYTGKLINVGFITQMRDLMHILLLSLFMGLAVRLTTDFLALPSALLLIIGVIEGAIIYLGGAIILRFSELKELRSLIKR
ncbi:MAG: lipopolysaccharide biosynthesis protein [Muribaculaceae bacterium]|nr:lipopolysaccharide biosynthesis protein [Muribaculaceae bacterium]